MSYSSRCLGRTTRPSSTRSRPMSPASSWSTPPCRWCRPGWRACRCRRRGPPPSPRRSGWAPGIRVVAAFHNVAAHKLQKDEAIDCDVLVFGDDPKDREVVLALAEAAGLRGIHGGPLANSVAAEALDLGAHRHQPRLQGGRRRHPHHRHRHHIEPRRYGARWNSQATALWQRDMHLEQLRAHHRHARRHPAGAAGR